jgi:hypothetical protein
MQQSNFFIAHAHASEELYAFLAAMWVNREWSLRIPLQLDTIDLGPIVRQIVRGARVPWSVVDCLSGKFFC